MTISTVWQPVWRPSVLLILPTPPSKWEGLVTLMGLVGNEPFFKEEPASFWLPFDCLPTPFRLATFPHLVIGVE